MIDLIVTVLGNLQLRQAITLEQVRGLVLYLRYILLIFQTQIRQDIFGTVADEYDLLVQERAAQPLHKIQLGVVYYLLQGLKNLAEPLFIVGEQDLHHYTLFLRAHHTHRIPMLFQYR